MHCLADHTSHSVEHQRVRLQRLTSRAIRDRAKRIYKILNRKCWHRLMKEKNGVKHRKKCQKVLILILGAISGQSEPPKTIQVQ